MLLQQNLLMLRLHLNRLQRMFSQQVQRLHHPQKRHVLTVLNLHELLLKLLFDELLLQSKSIAGALPEILPSINFCNSDPPNSVFVSPIKYTTSPACFHFLRCYV